MKTCKTCRYWKVTKTSKTHDYRGDCNRIVDSRETKDHSGATIISWALNWVDGGRDTPISLDDCVTLETVGSFGCTLHEEKAE